MTDTMEWLKSLERDGHGRVKDTLVNLKNILLNDEKLEGIAYNSQNFRIMNKTAMPWGRAGEYFSDWDEASLRVYIAETYGFDTSKKLATVIKDVSGMRIFNPVKDYLESLPAWDGMLRVDNLLVDYLGAEPSPYVRAVTRKALVAAVARIYEPGIKFDYVLVLNGKQGIGKSELFKRLAGKWHSDSLAITDMRDKTAAEKLQGKWIVELSELVGISKMDDATIKAFITREDDEYRDSYGKYCTSHKRQCILVGTANMPDGFLRDVTGNRRYWPVDVAYNEERNPYNLDEAEIKQIWAEALVYYKQGEKLYLDKELEQVAIEQQTKAMEQDSRAGIVRKYLDTPIPENWDKMSLSTRREWLNGSYIDVETMQLPKVQPRKRVSNIEIFVECFGKEASDLDNKQSRDITKIMSTIDGWEKSKRERISLYGQQCCYVKMT